MVWAELGAAYPKAGGSYNFLKEAYGRKGGKVLSFLYVWQTLIQAPLVAASGAIGFAQYCTYLYPFTPVQQKMVSGSIIILLVFLLYRKIETIGKISVMLWVAVLVTISWMIFEELLRIQFRTIGFRIIILICSAVCFSLRLDKHL